MDLSGIYSVKNNNVSYLEQLRNGTGTEQKNVVPFQSILDSAASLIQETNNLTNRAEEEEIKYALGMSDSIHDLQVAQQKANVSLQYTVAVRDAFVTAYRDIMNMQF